MRIVIIENNMKRINSTVAWLMYLLGNAMVLLIVSAMFKSLYIDNAYFGIYGLLAAFIISIFNVTIKPLIILLTFPITVFTLGLFYPFINVFILKIVDLLLGNHFTLKGIWIAFFIALLISIMNILMEFFIIKPLLKKGETICIR